MSSQFQEDLAHQLPYLRRYARALTGSRQRGDAYVRSTLEALIAEPSMVDHDRPPRVELYRLFHKICSVLGPQEEVEDVQGPESLTTSKRFQSLAPISRRVLLLRVMEGFTSDETAHILEIESAVVERHLKAVQAELDKKLATQVLIIEDEPLIAFDLAELVGDLGHSVVGVASTRDQAVKLAKSTRPGLVLADIQLADDSSGIDAVRDILSDHDVPVIFVTAFPEKLLTGKGVEPTYVITKPFEAETIHVAISQALFFRRETVA
jgi:CheY-like chemotaxis protein